MALHGKCPFVSGGTIGIAKQLAQRGANVFLILANRLVPSLGDRSLERTVARARAERGLV